MAIDPVTGRVTWTPTTGQLGAHPVTLVVSDGHGGSTSQSWSITVTDVPVNAPPVVVSVPDLEAVLGQPWSYPAHAVDPEGDAVTYGLVSPPAGMAINPNTGLASWTPGSTGAFTVALRASDPLGAFGAQVFTLAVVPQNAAPVITTTPPAAHTIVGGIYQYDVDATDADGHELTYSIIPAPSGMTIHPQTGFISWSPHVAQATSHGVTVRVRDGFGGTATQSFSVVVDPDLVPPAVNLALSSAQAAINAQARVCVEASDDVGVVERTLLVGGAPEALDLIGCAILSRPQPATLVLRGEARDAAGNVGSSEATLTIVDPSNGTAPRVTLIAPAAESVLTAPTDIVATIADDTPAFLTWEVSIAPPGSTSFTVIGSGNGTVTAGAVASLDTTLLANGTYRVRIVGADGAQTGGVEFNAHVSGNLKLGQFEISFNDLIVPLAGIPIVVRRSYSTLETATVGDFGAGWRLSLPADVTDSAAEVEADGGFLTLMGNEPFTRSTRVYVTRPDGKRVGFTFDPNPGFQVTASVEFTADPGVTDTLRPSGTSTVWDFGGRFFDFIIPYNPSTYVLTTREGIKYTIDESEGLQRIEDAQGNTITVTRAGLVSSTGVSIDFQRDAAGRITRIVQPDADPNDAIPPGELEYDYDAAGNLIEFRAPLDHPIQYFYENGSFPHYLTRMEDSLGRPVLRNVFDAEGRLIGQCGPDGNIVTLEGCSAFDHDAAARLQTVVNPRGYRTDYLLDARGNVLEQRRFSDAVTFQRWLLTYDAQDRLTSRTDPGGSTWAYTYDTGGNRLTQTDPAGRTWTNTFGSCDEVTRMCDPLGTCHTMTYDARCNLLTVTGPAGVTEFTYDSRGLRSTVREPNGNVSLFQYDARGRLSGYTDSSGNSATIVNNALGDLVSVTDRNGRTTSWQYDAGRNVVSETWDTVPPTVIQFTYDDTGRVAAATDGASALSYTYRNDGLLSGVDNAGTAGAPHVALTHEYDLNGNLTATVDSLGGRTEYEYDFRDRLAVLRQGGTGVAPKRLEKIYDDLTGDTVVRRFSDLAGMSPLVNTEYDMPYSDCRGLTRAIRHRLASDNSVIHDIDLVRDDIGRVVQVDDAEGTHGYSYDGARRLLGADHPSGGPQPDESYSYDGSGNRLGSHLSAGNDYAYMQPACSTGECGNQLLEDDGFLYQYDAEGNLLRRTDKATNGYEIFAYDHRNRLTAWGRFDALDAPLDTATYAYDLANRRIRATEEGIARHFVYDGQNPILVFDAAMSLERRRLYARPADFIQAEEVAGSVRWFLTDQVGTVRDVVDGVGAVLDHYVYDSFGSLMSESSPGFGNELRFTAREFSDLTGLGYFRARTYEPALGRFLGQDPRLPFGYDYALGDPLAFTDPSGTTAAVEYACLAKFGASASLEVVHLFYGYVLPVVFDRALSGQDVGSPWINLFQNWAAWSRLTGEFASDASDLIDGPCAVSAGDYLDGSVAFTYFDIPSGPCDLLELPHLLGVLCGKIYDGVTE